jgi:HD-GYP domain-containing protein (c-di-GMP phosphodiesterase class II)
MTITCGTSYEDVARHSIEEDPHYVSLVIDMAEQKRVVASEDVYATNGLKLITKNTIIMGGLKDRLLKHKLLKPIDQSLIVENGVTSNSVASEVTRLIDEDPRLKQLMKNSGSSETQFQQLANLPLHPLIAFKLTVAKEQQPRVFHHLLLVTLIAQYLGNSIKMPQQDLTRLLCAALFHDLGELYVDPEVMNSKRKLNDMEWRHIYAHPITSYLIAHAIPELDPAVSIAILQHQERQDGSGYPFGIRGTKIGTFARILSVADVCTSIISSSNGNDRLSSLMRLNEKKYDPKLLALLNKGFGHLTIEANTYNLVALPQLKSVAQLLENWGKFRAALSSGVSNNPPIDLEFLFERMVNLRSMLLQIGFDPDSMQALVEIAASDPKVARELSDALSELNWQFKDLEREISRWGEKPHADMGFEEKYVLTEWIQELHAYIEQFDADEKTA